MVLTGFIMTRQKGGEWLKETGRGIAAVRTIAWHCFKCKADVTVIGDCSTAAAGCPGLLVRDTWPGSMEVERSESGMQTGQEARAKCPGHKEVLKAW